jgi:hypothetical protein
MRQKIAILLLTLAVQCTVAAQTLCDSVWRTDVKTVLLYRSGAEHDFPMMTLGGGGRLTLEFDVLGTEPEALRWRLAHCDADWRVDELDPVEFINGFESGTIDDYSFSFTTLRDYVHYRAVVPGTYSEFTHSGNYILTVETDDEPSTTLLTRRFCISEQAAGIDAAVTRPYDGVELDRRQQVNVAVGGRWDVADGQLREEYLRVTVQQNGRPDTRRDLAFSGYDGDALTYRNRPCNIFAGGNTYRWFDCSNMRTPMYHVQRVEEYGGEMFAILRPDEDRSNKHYIAETVLRGGMKVNIWDRNNPSTEADYVWVNFSLPMAQPMLDGSVYIVGALTDWRMDESSRMDYNAQYRAYTKRMLLKQGYYSYQLLVKSGRRDDSRSATARLEGDHRETQNSYTVLVYYRSPVDRADRLVAARVLQ